MRWPPWRPDPDEVRKRREAEESLRSTLAQREVVEEAVAELQRHMTRNHLIEKAFAMRERGDR